MMGSVIQSSCPGKIILSGEYAVVFGYPGIAVPANVSVDVTWEDDGTSPMKIVLEGLHEGEKYPRKIVDECIAKGGHATGTLTIKNQIPVGRGMGSSTALVIAICRCLLGERNKPQAILVEDLINPGNSGLDFAVIWANQPVQFKRGTSPGPVRLAPDLLKNSTLIDTGKPGETTAELVAWMRSREKEVKEYLEGIGRCTERLLKGEEDPLEIIRYHHKMQVALGVVPKPVQELIAEIEKKGGAGKVLGAGARTGGGGMVLVLS